MVQLRTQLPVGYILVLLSAMVELTWASMDSSGVQGPTETGLDLPCPPKHDPSHGFRERETGRGFMVNACMNMLFDYFNCPFCLANKLSF